MSDREILRQASDNSDDWSDETWAAWGRLADQAHGHESGPALMTTDRKTRDLSGVNLIKIASRSGVDFFLQAQQPDGTWEEASSFINDLTEAEKRLARRRETRPEVTWRIVQRTTTVTLAVAEAGESK
ncbi:hypothetical protein [Streptomyces albidoflavus]|uniref:hypothetical protein n=1 Tax=Streptomyces albidoflavus TaxID=1886 RepID=UPI0033E7F416